MSKLSGKQKQKQREKERKEKEKRYLQKQQQLRLVIRKGDDQSLSTNCTFLTPNDDLSFIEDLKKVLKAHDNGVGLAANQIGVKKRAFVMYPLKDKEWINILINPVIIEKSEETIEIEEGCLSYPGISASTKRYNRIKLQYLDELSNEIIEEFEGFNAVVVQHEMDHLNGISIHKNKWIELGKPNLE